jgi:hypothetical protein
MLLAGCVGAAPGTGSGGLSAGPSALTGRSGGVDLDAAIREAAAQMGENLPGGTTVALVSVASSSMQFSEYVISRLEAALVSGKRLVVVDRANLDKIREEQGFQLSGEVDDNSAKTIGKLLGAGAIVTGSFANLGDVYSLTLKAIDMETATVAVSYPADIAKSTRIETLLASGGRTAGTQTAQRENTGRGTRVPASPAPPAPVYKIGDTGPAGGIIFYDKFSNAGGWRYLEAAPKETELSFAFGDAWLGGSGNTPITIGAGMTNTGRIIEAMQKEGIFVTAAQFCSDLVYGGYDDWFLPSRDELDLMFRNLRLKGLGGFENGWYWSSSHGEGLWGAYRYRFSDGRQDNSMGNENTQCLVRAVRAF